MFTLQIQDCDQLYLHPLDDRPIVIGSGADADLRLVAEGVQPRHLRIDCAAGAPPLLITLGGGTVTVNGRPVRRAPLRLGDRIEIGAAALVVGQSVARPAVPEDVLADAAAAGTARASRRRGRRNALVPLAITLALAVGGAFALPGLLGHSSAALAEVERLRRAGSFELAHARIAALRTEWVAGDAARGLELDAEAARVDELEAAVAARKVKMRGLAGQCSDAQLQAVLDREIEHGDDETSRLAAGIVRTTLAELVRDLPRAPAPSVADRSADPVLSDQPTAPSPERPQAAPATATAVPTPAPPSAVAKAAPVPVAAPLEAPVPEAADASAVLRDVDRFVGQELYAQAIDTLQTAIASARERDAGPLQTRLADVQAAARRAARTVVEEARADVAQGRVDAAIARLDRAAHRFPAGPDFAAVGTLLADLQRAPAPRAQPSGVDEATRLQTLASLRGQLEKIHAAEAAGDFAACADLLQKAGAQAKEQDADYAARLLRRADEFALMQEWHAAVGALIAQGQTFELQLRSGDVVRLRGTDGSALVVGGADGDRRATWLDVAAAGVARVVADGKLGGRAVLGAAALLYHQTEAADAEQLLARALKAEPALQPEIDRAVARGRNEDPGPGGYQLTKDGFVAVRVLEAGKEAQKLLARLDPLLRGKDKKAREAFRSELLARGPDALPAIVGAFQRALRQQVDQLDRSALKKQCERLDAQRTLLDRARDFARELIYDEVKYFYPYKPPQVSNEKFAEYQRVQAEVDRRVDALRELWQDEHLRIKIPAQLRDDLDRLDWTAATLSDLGALDQGVLAEAAWARALPAGDTVTIKNYCRTVAERDELQLWQRIEAYNDKLKTDKAVAVVEFDLLRVTNDYRAMYRHRPLALNVQLASASHGHAEEMSKLGYFSHFSPIPGRRTPFDRMKLCGYENGVSENIALADSASTSHISWLHSSGHHRNLLNPAHTEMGVGAISRDWVENFGQGKGWQQHAVWKAGEAKH
jgi:uncharacterized protein YkwD